MKDRLLEVSVVAKKLNISAQTVRRGLKDPDNPLKGIRVGKRSFRVFESSVEQVLINRQMC